MVSAPPRIIITTPIGSEIPPRCTGTCGCRCADNSRNHTLNLANTKPRLMTATLVLIQARKVRSLARYSVARFDSSIGALCFCFCICQQRNHDQPRQKQVASVSCERQAALILIQTIARAAGRNKLTLQCPTEAVLISTRLNRSSNRGGANAMWSTPEGNANIKVNLRIECHKQRIEPFGQRRMREDTFS